MTPGSWTASSRRTSGPSDPPNSRWNISSSATIFRSDSAQADAVSGTLSLGDLKRLELALALAGEPTLLLLDEPTAGMSGEERAALIDLVGRIVREREITVLFTEHDMDVVFSIASGILVMHQGRILIDGPPATVREDPEVQRVYLGGGA